MMILKLSWRKSGRGDYALDNEENETGVRCIACSLKEPMGSARHAFSISAPVSRMDNDRIRELADSALKVREEIAEKAALINGTVKN